MIEEPWLLRALRFSNLPEQQEEGEEEDSESVEYSYARKAASGEAWYTVKSFADKTWYTVFHVKDLLAWKNRAVAFE